MTAGRWRRKPTGRIRNVCVGTAKYTALLDSDRSSVAEQGCHARAAGCDRPTRPATVPNRHRHRHSLGVQPGFIASYGSLVAAVLVLGAGAGCWLGALGAGCRRMKTTRILHASLVVNPRHAQRGSLAVARDDTPELAICTKRQSPTSAHTPHPAPSAQQACYLFVRTSITPPGWLEPHFICDSDGLK